jgi:hypothetical protein
MPDSGTQHILERILEPLGRCLTPEAARQVLQLRADADAQARIDELADRNTAGMLSASERAEYEAYVAASSVIAILQIKAQRILTGQNAA